MESICYLCGISPSTTKDHIFPKNLFPPPRPSNLPTAQSCYKCNNSLCDDEEVFRAFVAAGEAYETETGRRVWDNRIRPSLKNNRRGFKTLLRKYVTKEGNLSILKPPSERINNVLRKITRGLYYIDTNKPLPNDVKTIFEYFGDDFDKLIAPPFDVMIQGAKRKDLGDHVVTYYRNTVKDDPAASVTWLVFYGVKAFRLLTYRDIDMK